MMPDVAYVNPFVYVTTVFFLALPFYMVMHWQILIWSLRWVEYWSGPNR